MVSGDTATDVVVDTTMVDTTIIDTIAMVNDKNIREEEVVVV